MIQELFTLKGVLHPTAIGDGFVVPLFKVEDGDPRPSYVQRHDEDSILAFDEIDTSEEVVLGTNTARQLSIGDRPLFAFRSSSRGIFIGNKVYLQGALGAFRHDYDHKPALKREVDRFLTRVAPKATYSSNNIELSHKELGDRVSVQLGYNFGRRHQNPLNARVIEKYFSTARMSLRSGRIPPHIDAAIREVLSRTTISKLIDIGNYPDSAFELATKRRFVWAMGLGLSGAAYFGISELLGQRHRTHFELEELVGSYVEFRLAGQSRGMGFDLVRATVGIALDEAGHLSYISRIPERDVQPEEGLVFRRENSLHLIGGDGERSVMRVGMFDGKTRTILGVMLSHSTRFGPFSTRFAIVPEGTNHPLFTSSDTKETFMSMIRSDAFFIRTIPDR